MVKVGNLPEDLASEEAKLLAGISFLLYLRKSNRVRAELGMPRSIQDRKWNWVTVRVSLVCRFFR